MELSNSKQSGGTFQYQACQIKKFSQAMNSNETPDHNRNSDLAVKLTVQIVALTFGLDLETLMKPRRGSAKIARARQVSCYLLHTSLSLPLVEIGKIFGKDRTTIGHACRLIEDLRDEPAFDDKLIELEHTVKLFNDLAGTEI